MGILNATKKYSLPWLLAALAAGFVAGIGAVLFVIDLTDTTLVREGERTQLRAAQTKDLEASKKTHEAIRSIGTSMMAWLTDTVSAAAAGQTTRPTTNEPQRARKTNEKTRQIGTAPMKRLTAPPPAPRPAAVSTDNYPRIERRDLAAILVPAYISEVPAVDEWGHEIEYFLNTEAPLSRKIMMIRSPGRDGEFEGETYVPGSFSASDHDRDIVWADAFFVRWAEKQAGP